MVVEKNEEKRPKFDFVIFILMILLIIIGELLIASSSNIFDTNDYHLLISQAIWFVLGLVAFFVLYFIDYRIIINFHIFIYVLILIMLLYVDLKGISILGGQRWIKIGPFSFQPSEITKLLMVLFISKIVSKYDIKKLKNLLIVVGLSIIPILLIFYQPDLGTASVVLAIMIVILFIADINLKYFLYAFLSVVIMIPIAWKYILFSHHKERILIFLNPELDPLGKGYQVIQSKIAIGSGRLFGKGLFMGTMNRLNYLPVKETDFIFGVAGEELGFIGCSILILLFAILIWRLISIALNIKDKTALYIVCGIAGMLAFQLFVNIGMTMRLVPVTGIPLPFISYGGSSLITSMASLGVVENIYKQNIKTIF